MLIGIFTIYSAQSVQALSGERTLFAVITGAALMLALPSLGRDLPAPARRLSVLWIAGCVLYLVVSLFQVEKETKYVVGDSALALLPLLVMLAFAGNPRWLRDLRIVYVLIALLAAAAVLAKPLGTLGPRHDAPSTFLMASAWYFLIRSKNPISRAGWLVLVLAIGYLAYDSGFRTHLILWALAPVITIAVVHGPRAMLGAALAAVVAYLGLGLADVEVGVEDALNDSRFQALTTGQRDASLDSRLLEFRDVLRTAENDWVPGQIIVGSGFGASYKPHHSYIAQNVSENGLVHSIHIGPALVFFRFGLLGCFLFGALVWWLMSMFRKLRCGRISAGGQPVTMVFALTVSLYLLQFLVLNSTVEPPFAFALGGLLATWAFSPSGSPPRRDAASRLTR